MNVKTHDFFVLTGNMYILSHDTNIDTHDCVALLPDGKICYYYFFNYYYYSSRSNKSHSNSSSCSSSSISRL